MGCMTQRAASTLINSIYGCCERWSSATSRRLSASCAPTSAKENRMCFQICSKDRQSANYVVPATAKQTFIQTQERKRNGRRSSDKKWLGGNTRRDVSGRGCDQQRENRCDRR